MLRLDRFLAILLTLALLLPISALAACTPAPALDIYQKAILTARSEIWQDINTGKAGSATVAIMDGGAIVYSEGFGMADREKSVPVGKDTLFNIGSITKVFTATAIMLLVDDGKVKLDDPVTKYLPEFTMADPQYKDITVRMTLNHACGLPGTTGESNFGFEYNSDFFKQTLENLSRAHLAHPPGAMAPYTNDGFTLAEMIVERVSGQKFTDFLSQRALKPLGLSRTGLSVGQRPGEAIAAYYQPASGKREPPEAVTLIGAGGFAGTAEDLCRFQDMFSGNGPQILSASSLAEMKKGQPSLFSTKLKNPQFSWGLGWDFTGVPVFETKGVQVLGKSGGTMNYSSMMFTAPAQRLSVAVIETGSASAQKIAGDIMKALLVQKGLVPDDPTTVSKPPEPEPIPPQYASFEGYYAPLQRISFDLKTNRVTCYAISGGVETPAVSLIYHGGSFYDPEGGQSYFTTVDGQDYGVGYFPGWGVDNVSSQKLKKLDKPLALRVDVNGKEWLLRNVKPFESPRRLVIHVLHSSAVAGLPGYVYFGGIKEIKSPDFAGMPVGNLRDQNELTLVDKNGQTWALLSEMLFSPGDAAASLAAGNRTVTIGKDGYTEWLRADAGLILSFEKPAKGRIVVFSADGVANYDSAVDSAEVYAAKGSLVEFLGYAGDTFKVTAR